MKLGVLALVSMFVFMSAALPPSIQVSVLKTPPVERLSSPLAA
jgi:hypothetical protein